MPPEPSRADRVSSLFEIVLIGECWSASDSDVDLAYAAGQETSLDVYTEEGNIAFTLDNLLLTDRLAYVREQIVELFADDAPQHFQFWYRGSLVSFAGTSIRVF